MYFSKPIWNETKWIFHGKLLCIGYGRYGDKISIEVLVLRQTRKLFAHTSVDDLFIQLSDTMPSAGVEHHCWLQRCYVAACQPPPIPFTFMYAILKSGVETLQRFTKYLYGPNIILPQTNTYSNDVLASKEMVIRDRLLRLPNGC